MVEIKDGKVKVNGTEYKLENLKNVEYIKNHVTLKTMELLIAFFASQQ